MSEQSRTRALSGRAWEDFCDQLKAAGRMIDRFGDDELDEQDRTEYYRFLARVTRNGLERFIENCEPERPRLRETPWRQSINFQSPDQDHLLAEFVDGSHDYVIRGQRGGLPYFVIATWTAPQPAHPGAQDWADQGVDSLAGFDPSNLKTTGFITSDQVNFADDDRFEIVVSQSKPADGRDWLPMTADCVGLLVRTLYDHRGEQLTPVFTIERADQPRPRPLKACEVGDGLAKAAQTVFGYGELVRRWWQDNLATRPNRIRFSKAVYLSNGGVPDRHHGFGTWECDADQALVIEFVPSPCKYWIFQLCTIWQENLDNYEDGDGYITQHRHQAQPDGTVRVVICGDDPGIAGNRVGSFGHRHGGMSLRFIGLNEGCEPPAVSLRRLGLVELRRDGEAALQRCTSIISGEVE